jgi:hypothetical protein
MDGSPDFRFWWPFGLTSNFGAVVSLYRYLPIATGIHTTKPAETLKTIFGTVAFIANPFFPIWNLRHRATNVAHTRIAVLLFVPGHSELNYLRATLPTQRHAVPRGLNLTSVFNCAVLP